MHFMSLSLYKLKHTTTRGAAIFQNNALECSNTRYFLQNLKNISNPISYVKWHADPENAMSFF